MSDASSSPIEGEVIDRFEIYADGKPPWPVSTGDGPWVRFEDHAAAMFNARHERNFWSWKYERREAECKELAVRLRAAKVMANMSEPSKPEDKSAITEPAVWWVVRDGVTVEQIQHTPFKKVWKGGFSKRNRKLIKRALRKELKWLEPDTQEWRDVRTVLALMGEEHHSKSELERDQQEETKR